MITPGRLPIANTAKATRSVREAAFPKTVTQLKSFLGACNVYRRFVKGYAKIASPLSDMLRKDAARDWDNPTEEQSRAFEELKARLTSPPILALPKPGRPIMVDTDASAYAVGAVLLQQQDEDDLTSWATIGYWSKTLTKEQRNYSATERECYAVVWAVLTLRSYLEGAKFLVRTDHNALRWMMTLNEPNGRLMIWRLRLMEFDYEITYRPGRVHQVPDALSRIEQEGPEASDQEVDDEIPSLGDHVQVATNSADNVHVVTRRQAAAAPTRGASARVNGPTAPPTGAVAEAEHAEQVDTTAEPDLPPEQDCLPRTTPLVRTERINTAGPLARWRDDSLISLPDEAEEVDDAEDIFLDIQRLAKERQPSGAHANADALPAPLSKQEIVKEQRLDDYCQTVQATQLGLANTLFFEDEDGMLCRQHPRDSTIVQAVLPSSIRHRLLRLAHHSPSSGQLYGQSWESVPRLASNTLTPSTHHSLGTDRARSSGAPDRVINETMEKACGLVSPSLGCGFYLQLTEATVAARD